MAKRCKRGRGRRLPRNKKGRFMKRGHRSYKSFNKRKRGCRGSKSKRCESARLKRYAAAKRRAMRRSVTDYTAGAQMNRRRNRRRNGSVGSAAARLRGMGGSAAGARYGVEHISKDQAREKRRRAAKKAARTRAAKHHKRSLAAKRAARKRKSSSRRRAAASKRRPRKAKKGSRMARRKKGRSKASRKAAARKAARTRVAKKEKRRRAARKAARKRKRKGSRKGRRRGKRAILRVRRHGRSVSALCKAANRKRRNAGYRPGAGSSGVLQLNRKRRNKHHRKHYNRKRRNELPFVGGLLKKIPGGAYIDQAVPYIGGGVIGVLGANVLPRYIPGNGNKWVSLGYSVLGTAAAAWGSHKFLKSEKLALGAAVLGGFSVLAKLVAAFTSVDSPIRNLVGIGMSDLNGYAGLGDQLEMADDSGYGGGSGYDLDYTDGSNAIGGDFDAPFNVAQDGISVSDDDMADMIEMRDFAEIR